MVDNYTKIVLTVIAIALCVLAVQNTLPTQTASAFGESECGTLHEPCHLRIEVSVRQGKLFAY